MPAYVCDSANKTHCQNGGTCVINNFDGKPHCVCLIVSNETAENCVEFQTYVDRRVNRAIDRVLTATTIGVAATVIIGIVVLSWYLARRSSTAKPRPPSVARNYQPSGSFTPALHISHEVQVRSPTDNHRSEAPKSAAAAATTVKTANKSTSTMQTGIESAMLPQSAMMDRRPRHQAAAFTDPFAAPLVHQQPAVPHHANEFQVLPPPRQNGPQQQQQRFSSGAISRQVSSGAASSGGRSRCPSGGCYPYDYHQSPSTGEASTFEARIYPVFDYGDCLQRHQQQQPNPQLMPVANNSVRGQYFGFNNS
uniref:EGF-like domain-containing protein n=1 Tax=Macrostomum lignano TaxID=282301 RepID=A0A1I8IYP5_9PLAT